MSWDRLGAGSIGKSPPGISGLFAVPGRAGMVWPRWLTWVWGKASQPPLGCFPLVGSSVGPEEVCDATLGLSAGKLLQRFPRGLPKSVSQKLMNQKCLRRCEEWLIHTSNNTMMGHQARSPGSGEVGWACSLTLISGTGPWPSSSPVLLT